MPPSLAHRWSVGRVTATYGSVQPLDHSLDCVTDLMLAAPVFLLPAFRLLFWGCCFFLFPPVTDLALAYSYARTPLDVYIMC